METSFVRLECITPMSTIMRKSGYTYAGVRAKSSGSMRRLVHALTVEVSSAQPLHLA